MHYTRDLLALRARTKALGNTGGWKMVSNPYKPYPVVYERFDGAERYLVVLNPRETSAEITINEALSLQVVYGDKKALTAKQGKGTTKVKIKGVSAVICKIN